MTAIEKQEIEAARASLKRLREMALVMEDSCATLYRQLLAIDDRLLDLMYPQGVESPEFKLGQDARDVSCKCPSVYGKDGPWVEHKKGCSHFDPRYHRA